MRAKNFIFILSTIFLAGIISFCIGGTVKGQSRERESELLYQLREAELLWETREYLNRSGFQNSGVTLTRVVDEEGRRAYTFTIHHSRIDRMNEGERQMLRERLFEICHNKEAYFREDICSFRHEFLIVRNMR